MNAIANAILWTSLGVNGLGADSQAARDASSRALESSAFLPVLRCGISCRDAEVRLRCRRLLGHHAAAFAAGEVAKVRPTLLGCWPDIDRLPEDFVPPLGFGTRDDVRALYLGRQPSHPLDFVTPCLRRFRAATRDLAHDLVRAGWPAARVNALLDGMAAAELDRTPGLAKIAPPGAWEGGGLPGRPAK